MKEPIIPIRRVREEWTTALIEAGILSVTEDGRLTTADTWRKTGEAGDCT